MIQDLLSKYKTQLGASTQLRAQVNLQSRIGLLGGNLVSNTQGTVAGVNARVYQNGVYGFASQAEYSDASIAAVIQAAKENAAFLDSRVQKGAAALPPLPAGETRMSRKVEATAQKRYIDFAQQVDAYIQKKYPSLASRMVSVHCDSMEKLLCVGDGFDSYSLVPRSHIYIGLTANTADGSTVELFTPFGGAGYFNEQFNDPAALYAGIDELYVQLMQKAEGVYPDAGMQDVVLHARLAGMLAHEAVGHTVESDLVLAGSVAAHNLNKPVASELVTLVDYAHTGPDGNPAPLPIFVDDEGTPAEDAVLIENGILKGYMHNRESAAHFETKPQGNARAFEFSDEPLIRMRNTAILPGKDKLADMLACIENGYYLTETGNGQADTTGEFMFGVNMGYEIKNGKLGRAIRDTTISGVAFDMLKTVDMLSDELFWVCSGYCGKKQAMPVGMGGPAIKCRVNIGGR